MKGEIKLSVTEPQNDFLGLDCMYPAFIGGLGSGKSHIMAISGLLDASGSSDALVAFYEPTHNHLKTIIIPRVEQLLTEFGIRYTLNKQDHMIYTSTGQFGDFIFQSLDNPTLIVGYECYRAHIDELDVLPEEKAREAWIKIIARARQKLKGSTASTNRRVSVYSTPEGYKFVYKMWGASDHPEYKMVKAFTASNPHLPDNYIQTLVDSYPESLIRAYLEGEFVNLASATVYNGYNRSAHESSEKIEPGETLFIGCDFNINKQAATVYVKRNGGLQWHAVAELVDMRDTPEMIRILKEQWHNNGHHIVLYPDASGKAGRSANASISDIALLQSAGFEIRARKKNPDVKDRVQAANKAFSDGRVKVNTQMCPTVARCLEQQAYDKNGEPDKRSGHDHQNDATTYPLAYEFALKKPMFALDFSFVT